MKRRQYQVYRHPRPIGPMKRTMNGYLIQGRAGSSIQVHWTPGGAIITVVPSSGSPAIAGINISGIEDLAMCLDELAERLVQDA